VAIHGVGVANRARREEKKKNGEKKSKEPGHKEERRFERFLASCRKKILSSDPKNPPRTRQTRSKRILVIIIRLVNGFTSH
jgi:hypothetical protein